MAAIARTVAAGACVPVLCVILFAGVKIKGTFPSFLDEVPLQGKERGGATTEAEMLDRLMGEAAMVEHGASVAPGADAGRSLHGWIHQNLSQDYACKEDMARFCLEKMIQQNRAGEPAFDAPCLKGHMAELTPSCSSKLLAKMPVSTACREDQTRFCPMQSLSGGDTSCLQAHMAELSALCSSKLSHMETRRKQLEIQRKCASKYKELCVSRGVPMEQRMSCMRQHLEADEECHEASHR
jgi:hypothetical protein